MAFPPEGGPVATWMGTFGGGGKKAYKALKEQFDRFGGRALGLDAVRLRSKDGDVFGIKAYSVQGLESRTYVASAGPTAETIEAFWALVVVEMKVEAILMLNGFELLLFGPTEDLPQYWPLVEGESMVCGQWTIRCVWTRLKQTSKYDSLKVTDVQHCLYRVSKLVISSPSTQPKEVKHVCHYKWRDQSIPQSVQDGNTAEKNALQLVNLITNPETLGRATVVLVHCKAGVGRTGTAILLDIAATRLTNHGKADVEDTLGIVRDQRPDAVATEWQYAYVNIALARLALERLDRKYYPGVFKDSGMKGKIEECWKEMRKGMPQGLD